ncbi:MAG: hypothetical protein F6J87_11430 [Spirulina sp. SIO3F2]|nr:hypothetical protein [Spirulina sp. SIO3F2]
MTNFERLIPLNQPMTAGNVVNAAIQLYRSRWLDYLVLSSQALLWLFIALALWGMLGVVFTANPNTFGFASEHQTGLVVLLIVIAILATVYCGARSLVCGATMSRLAFGELQQQPETRKTAHQWLRRRLWRLFWAFVCYIIRLFGVYCLISIGVMLILLVVGLVGVALSNHQLALSTETEDLIVGILGLIIFFGLFVGIVFTLLWAIARLFVYEVLLAIADLPQVGKVLGQSWQLTKGHGVRIIRVIVVAALVTLPLLITLQVVMALTQSVMIAIIPLPPDQAALLGSYSIGLIGNFLILPLWQILKGVACYDLKSCQEGIDLSLLTS